MEAPVRGAGPAYNEGVDAEPVLAMLARALHEEALEAILIGNLAAALHGAPVSTIDADFLFRKSPRNIAKLKRVAQRLGARLMKPFYPASDLYQLQREDDALQVDFMIRIDGIRSYESLRSRAKPFQLGGAELLVAALADVIRSKRAAGRPKDRAILEVLEATLRESEAAPNSKEE